MPGRDGTGPMGRGTMTGRGLGFCTGANVARCGIGLVGLGLGLRYGYKRGWGRNFSFDSTVSKTEKELLTEKKEFIQKELEIISNQLENLSETI